MNRKILVVDDEQGIRAALGQLLEYEGYEVRTVSNAADGISEYQKWKPNLVFMDVKMAGMDGLEVLHKLRHLVETTPIVVISGHADITTAVEATRLGAFDFIEKPLERERVIAVLPISNTCVVTSGDYERFFIRDGHRYHHILDPDTGEPAARSRSVSILAKSTTVTDGLSTGVFILGGDEGMALIEKLPDVEGVIVTAENRVLVSSGLKGRLVQLKAPSE